MPDEHTSAQYEASLDEVRSQLQYMGGLVERQIQAATRALCDGEVHLIDGILASELEINRLERALDELCATLIARYHPAAIDLRLAMMVLKAVTDLERIGDEAKKMAFIARALHGGNWRPSRHAQIRRAADVVTQMLRSSLSAFSRLDSSEATDICDRDQEVDRTFAAVLREQLTCMAEDPRTISSALELIFAAKSLERIGDHAKNLCEYTVYLTEGTDVRHRADSRQAPATTRT